MYIYLSYITIYKQDCSRIKCSLRSSGHGQNQGLFLWLSSMSLRAVLEPVPRFSAQQRATSEDIAPGIWIWCPLIVYYETASMCLSGGAVWEEGRVITKPFWCGPGDFLFQLAIYHAGRGLQNEGWPLHLASGSTDGRQQGASGLFY